MSREGDGRHHDLVATVPELRGDRILLNAHADEDAAAHAAGEDEETARRFGWWPARSTEETVRAAYANWARNWRDDGPTRAFAARDPETGALVGGCELRIGPDKQDVDVGFKYRIRDEGQIRGWLKVVVAKRRVARGNATPCDSLRYDAY